MNRDTPDPQVVRAAELSEALHAWLRERPEGPPQKAGALGYEVAALIALHARSVEEACAMVDAWAHTMKDQIREFGVGVEHP
jgi:hypothetical protein